MNRALILVFSAGKNRFCQLIGRSVQLISADRALFTAIAHCLPQPENRNSPLLKTLASRQRFSSSI